MQTSQKSIFDIIEETSTSSAEASPVNPTQAQASDLEKKMTATSGQRCCDAFERFPRVGSWARMFSALLIGQEGWSSTKCRLTWKLKGTRFSRMYFQLVPSTLPTEGTESGLLLTPTSVMTDEPPEKMRERAERNGYKNGTQYGSLLSQVKYSGMLPTPTASECRDTQLTAEQAKKLDKGGRVLRRLGTLGMLPTPTTDSAMNRKENYKQGGTPLSVAVNKMLPTPTAQIIKHSHKKEYWDKRIKDGRQEDLSMVIHGHNGMTSRLNPQFVEEMMGFPENWTASPFQSGETNQSKPTETQ